MYEKIDIFAEMDANRIHFTQPSDESPTKFSEALWNKPLWWDIMHEEYISKGIFIEGLAESIHHNMTSYLGSKKNVQRVHNLAHHVISLKTLQNGSCDTESTCINNKTENRRGNNRHVDGNANDNKSNVSSWIL